MTPIYTDTEQQIADLLATMPTLAQGLGREERACSFGAVHLALTGTLKDTPLDCASEVIWRWGIIVQDRAPADVCRDHPAWRALLPLVSGTGREHEEQRGQIVLDWMWDALALVQPRAEARGYGEAWARMCRERTRKSAKAAAADAAAYAAAAAAADAWRTLNPCALLQRLIAVTDERALLVDCTMETPTRGADT